MKFEEALTHLKDGKKIKRPGWEKSWCKNIFNAGTMIDVSLLNVDDWKIVEDPRKVFCKINVLIELSDIEDEIKSTFYHQVVDEKIIEVKEQEFLKYSLNIRPDFIGKSAEVYTVLDRREETSAKR